MLSIYPGIEPYPILSLGLVVDRVARLLVLGWEGVGALQQDVCRFPAVVRG